MKKLWHMVAISLMRDEINVLSVIQEPQVEKSANACTDPPDPMNREDALKIVKSWNDYNEYWQYGLIENDCYTPNMFSEKKNL